MEEIMDILYRLFYTVFSMSCMLVVLLPLVFLLRFLFRKLPGKFTVALWTIFYIRAVCPLGLTSPVVLFSEWNRRFHLLLRAVGLNMIPDRGLLTGWFQVFQSEIDVTIPYMMCTIFWTAGVAGFLFFAWMRQRQIRSSLTEAKLLFDNIFESEEISEPIRTGIFRQRIYLPEGLSAKEMKNILLHQQLHGERRDDGKSLICFVISCLHWWNPLVWLALYYYRADRERACDEAVLQRLGWDNKNEYAQDILNMKRENVGEELPRSLFVLPENRLESRAEHMLYIESVGIWKKAVAAFLLTVCVFCWFALSAFHSAWNGGVWAKAQEVQEEPLFQAEQERGVTNEVIARCDTQTDKGTEVTLELLMTQGTFQKGRGYQGQTILRMKDAEDNTRDSLTLSQVFTGNNVQKFQENITLSLDDYNEDGVMELALGQQMEVKASRLSAPATPSAATGAAASKKKQEKEDPENGNRTVQGYYLINIEDDQLRIISDPIYVSQVTDLQESSMLFSYIEDTGGIITTQLEGDTAYYVWDRKEKRYSRQAITQEEIDSRRTVPEASTGEGETNAYTLQDSREKTVIRVATRTDAQGNPSIENVTVNPQGVDRLTGTQEFKDIKGNFRAIDWVEQDDSEQYAILTYYNADGQSFVIFDVKKRKIYYQQEDGNRVLQKLFESYGDEEITFAEGDMVVYQLMELKKDGTLRIRFAADVQDGASISGSFVYQKVSKKVTQLQYSQSMSEKKEGAEAE